MFPTTTPRRRRLASMFTGAPEVEAQGAAPQAQADPQAARDRAGYGYGAPVAGDPAMGRGGVGGLGPKKVRRRLMNLGYANAVGANPMMWQGVNQLQQQANTFDPTQNAAQYAGQYEQVSDYFDRARSNLNSDLLGRGLGDSSAMASGMGALEAGRAEARAGVASDIYGEERQRQRMDQARLLDFLAALQGRSTGQAAGIAGDIRGDAMQQAMMDQGSFLESLLGDALGMGGYLYGRGRIKF